MKVIGAGLGRTGTMSLKAALEELGFGPCYRMSELAKNPAHHKVWDRAAWGEPVVWGEVFGDYQATVDWPGCAHYKELMQAYPEAKVLLSIRDPDQWYDSMINTVYSHHKAVLSEGAGQVLPPRSVDKVWDLIHSGKFEDRRLAVEAFNQHNEEVKSHVPADRLLVYEVKDGWGPLCGFLDVEAPEGKAFPRLNDAEGSRRRKAARTAAHLGDGNVLQRVVRGIAEVSLTTIERYMERRR